MARAKAGDIARLEQLFVTCQRRHASTKLPAIRQRIGRLQSALQVDTTQD